MQIINDRSITVSTGTGRKCTNWQPAVMTLGELYDRLHTPIRGEETLAAYMQMSKTERDNRKDIGGFGRADSLPDGARKQTCRGAIS